MVITKISPLSIQNHLRVINLTCLKQRFDDCLFQVSFYLYNLYLYIGKVFYRWTKSHLRYIHSNDMVDHLEKIN